MNCPECGSVYTVVQKKQIYDHLRRFFGAEDQPRSVEQHRRFFGMIRKAHEQWPDQHDFQALNAEHLRAWLLCMVGHHHVETVQIDVTKLSEFEVALMRAAYESPYRASKKKVLYRFWRIRNGHAYVISPLSIAFEECKHEDVCKVMRQVDELVCEILGIEDTELLFDKRFEAA
jgi:hypothetical protein